MGEIIKVYGTDVALPDLPPLEEIEDWGQPPHEQYWRRKKMPDIFKRLEYDKEGNIELTQRQQDFCLKELDRIENGFWFYNNGIPTYITGRNYYYLQYWTLENKKAPEYRDVSRRYFLFINHWRKVWWCRGVMRGKSRRSGATSESSSNLACEATTVKNSKCGIISKTSADARKVFIFRVQFGYRHLVFFLQPSLSNDKDSKSELVFNVPISKTKKVIKAKLIDDVEGLNSMIDYQPTALNSYDSERLSYILIDEGGKFPPDVPFSQFLSVISETLVEGSERVGFAEIPSTVNEMTKKGGAEFKLAWDAANQFLIQKRPLKKDRTEDEDSEDYFDVDEDLDDNDECTVNMFVRYYVPAYDGLAGFIDQHGMSIIDNPTPEQMDFVFKKTGRKIRYGARKYLENRRAKMNGAALEEEKRKYSFDEDEMFMQAGVGCEYNAANFQNQIKWVKDNPQDCYWRQSRLVLKKEKIKSIFPHIKEIEKRSVGFMDDKKGGWFILEEPLKPNAVKDSGGYLEPLNKIQYQIGVDTTQDRVAVAGSNPAITVFKKSLIINGEEMGLYPVALWISPTRLDIHFDEEVLKASIWYGCESNYEIDRRTDFYRYFCKENCQAFLTWTPKIMMNPLKPNKQREYGSRSGDPFQLAQMLQISKLWADGDNNEIYNGHIHRCKHVGLIEQGLHYNHLDRTKSDLWVSLQMALVPVFGDMQMPKRTDLNAPIKILPQYKIKIPA